MLRPLTAGIMLMLAGTSCALVAGFAGDAKLGDPVDTGGTGAQSGTGGFAPSFAFAITDATVNVPLGGLNYVHLAITPSGGFSGSVAVTSQEAPSGLITKPLTIPAGSTTGVLEVGADMPLTLGTTFNLTLTAASGSMMQTATVPAVVTGKPGDFDLSFGGNGLVAGPSGSGNNSTGTFNDVQEVAQGKILAGGFTTNSQGQNKSIGLRLLPNGGPDSSFNGNGIVTNGFCTCVNTFGATASVAREVDGTILFVGNGQRMGSTINDIFVFRYNDDGTPSVVQGDTGTEEIKLTGSVLVAAAVLVPNTTKVVVAGSNDQFLAVARIADRQAGGSPDQTFAAPNGFIVPPLGGVSSSAGAVTIDSMGRIVVTGWVTDANMDSDVVLLRLAADGSLDPSFGAKGMLTLPRPGNQHGSAVLVQPDGNIVVAADTTEGGTPQFLVQRFTPSGTPDMSFGTAGVVLAPLGMTLGSFSGPTVKMVLMPDGRIVVAGNPDPNAPTGPVFARFFSDGQIDPTFGPGGEVTVFVGMQGTIGAMTLANDGKLIIAGSTGSTSGSKSYVARLWN